MKYASFAKLRDLDKFSCVGFDGVELDSCELRALGETQFDELEARLEALGLKVCACSWIMENTVHICDEAFDRDGWLKRFQCDGARLARLGCPVMVFAAGPIRTVGHDADSKRKSQVINSFIRDTAQVFKTYGVKVALETVCGDYTDYLMYLRQSAEVCGDSEESNIYLLTDIRHLVRAGDEPNDILKYRQKIIHAHIDNPINERRFAPMPDDGYNYEFFVRRVLQTGAEWISYECHDEVDWYVSGPASLDYIRSLVGKIEMEKAGLPLG